MADPVTDPKGDPKVDPTPEPDPEPTDDERFKDDPAYKPMSAQIAKLRADNEALQKEKDDRIEAEKKAKHEAAIKKAEDEKNYEEAQKLRDDEYQRKIDDLESKAFTAELRSELAVAGFKPRGIDLLAAEYDAEKYDTVEAYVKAAKEDEANKDFLSSTNTREPKDPPPKAGTSGNGIDWNQVKAWETSKDRKERIKARELLAQYRKDNKGEYPYKM